MKFQLCTFQKHQFKLLQNFATFPLTSTISPKIVKKKSCKMVKYLQNPRMKLIENKMNITLFIKLPNDTKSIVHKICWLVGA